MTRAFAASLCAAVLCQAVLISAQQASPPGSAGDATTAGPARHAEEGRPLVRSYRPFEVGGGTQTWALVQDSRGVIYAGTNTAVLEFDGASWRRIPVTSTGSVRALAIDATGRIYAAGSGALGYLEPDAAGALRYVSLLDRLPPNTPSFNEVWRVFCLADAVWFQSESALYRWANNAMTVVPAASRFNRSSSVDNRVYVPTPESGLTVLEGTVLKPLPGTEQLKAEPFPVILRYDEKRLLIGTRRDGFFLYDGAALTPFPTEFDSLIKSTQVYRGTLLPDGSFVITTTNAGFFIMDRQGRRVVNVDRATGLFSDTVYFALRDREGALWLGQDAGVTRVETPSPLTFFDNTDGLVSFAQNMTRIDGRLLVAMQSGANYLIPAADARSRPRFANITGTNTQCWDFSRVPDPDRRRPDAVLLACGDGLMEIQGTAAIPVKAPADLSFRPNVLLVSAVDPTRIWLGLFDGLASFRRVDGKWIDEGRVAGSSAQVRTLFENPDGSIWAGTQNAGAVLAAPASRPDRNGPRPVFTIKEFGEADGLQAEGVAVVNAGGKPLFAAGITEQYFLEFDDKAGRFVRDRALDNLVGFDPVVGGTIQADTRGRLFVNAGKETAVVTRKPDGTWSVDKQLFSRLGTTLIASVFPEDNGVAWMQFFDGRLVRFDTAWKQAAPATLATLIRGVQTTRGQQVFGGAAGGAEPAKRLEPDFNSLRFEFSAPTYLDESATEYQSKLEGFDDDWSPWARDAKRELTNLGAGNSRFRVRARSVTGAIADEASYAFTILPPWYRTWWAYAGYAAGALLLMAAVASLQRRRVVTRERERAQVNEVRLRAEAAELLARTEGEGKRNVELLSEIGREITASLDFDTIFGKVYERVNELADADVFGVGLYHPERQEIEYRLAIEKGKRYTPYTRTTTDRDQLPVWCIEHKEPIFINDLQTEYKRYISAYAEKGQQLEDGTLSQQPQSLIYLPLLAKDRVLGIVTIQSFEKNAYTQHHLNVMRGLASYTAVALDNADAYKQLNEHEHEIRRLFEDAQRARATAEEADAAKSAFLSTVSHELRTPLTSVLGFAKIIKKRLEDRIFPLVSTGDAKVQQTVRQVDDNLKVVISEGERLTKLIDDVLDLAKIEAGKLEWHMETMSIGEVIDRATAATSSLLDQKGLTLVKNVDADLPAVTADTDRIIQVVINLISNAVKFTDGGSVTCRAVRQGPEIVVSVVDTGVGIAAPDQPKVFERFKQVGDTLTDKPKGTGLGLPICKEIVEHHGGRIWVESVPGEGSTFSFSLPLTAEQAAGHGGPVDLAALIRQLREQVVFTTPRTTERQPRILVVDDDENIRSLLQQELGEAGYDIQLAGNGREAIASVRRERPDLVILDVMMPEMNGFDVAAVLKNDPQTMDVPILILSIVQDRDRGFRLGVDRYLTKPIDTDLQFREVGRLIEQKKSKKRVLVVDDDASTVRTLTDVLTSRGYSVNEARGEDLIARALAIQPDIIMLSSGSSARSDAVQTLRFEKGMENVLLFVYQ
jgi:signal transduction histidine kinase/CheY-like chemotaxis protein